MKRKVKAFIALFIGTWGLVISQDTLVLITSAKIPVAIEDIGSEEIQYRNFMDPDAATFSIRKSDVDYVVFADGFKQKMEAEDSTGVNESPRLLYVQGQTDATRFYDGYKGAGTGTLIISLLSPLVGLIPAIACSATKPAEVNLGYPDSHLYHNPDYQRGYMRQAKKIKSSKVWTNWFVAFGVNVVLVLATSGSGQ